MSYQVRLLPPEEWPKLAGTEAERAWPVLNPVNTRVLVVEEADRIVGVWIGLRLMHVECLWIEPGHRRTPGIWSRLIMGMRRVAHQWDATNVLTSAFTDDMVRMVEKVGGTKMPGTLFAIPTEKREAAHGH